MDNLIRIFRASCPGDESATYRAACRYKGRAVFINAVGKRMETVSLEYLDYYKALLEAENQHTEKLH
ncbi:MAG: hypothetical protein AAGB19_15370, partial [Cyanobacteria bacterium P01_F01_bin.3]